LYFDYYCVLNGILCLYTQLIECPSVYELIASQHFDWSEPPELRLWRKQAEENGEAKVKLQAFGPRENLDVMMAALEENKVRTIVQ
jgi:hypothetical protein